MTFAWLQLNAARGWVLLATSTAMPSPITGSRSLPVLLLAPLRAWDGQISIARATRAEGMLLRQAGITKQQAFVAWYIPFRLCVGTSVIIGGRRRCGGNHVGSGRPPADPDREDGGPH